jgi:hypothetical protein
LPFSTEFSEEEDASEAEPKPESETNVDGMKEQIDEIESHFINMPTLYPTADASV